MNHKFQWKRSAEMPSLRVIGQSYNGTPNPQFPSLAGKRAGTGRMDFDLDSRGLAVGRRSRCQLGVDVSEDVARHAIRCERIRLLPKASSSLAQHPSSVLVKARPS